MAWSLCIQSYRFFLLLELWKSLCFWVSYTLAQCGSVPALLYPSAMIAGWGRALVDEILSTPTLAFELDKSKIEFLYHINQ